MKGKIVFLFSILFVVAFQLHGVCADDLSPEKLIAAHLKSIGLRGASASQIKSIVFIGTADADLNQGIVAKMNGFASFVSQGTKTSLVMKFPDPNYPEEHFAYDGKSVTVQNIQPGIKTPFADFIVVYNKIMKNGLLGGVFSNAWPLLDIKRSKPSFMEVSKKTVDKTELYMLEYRPKDRHGDMKIRMFFDQETFRHVRTEYKVSLNNDASSGTYGDPDADGDRDIPAIYGLGTGSTFYTLVEKFGNFKEVGPLTMPHSYELDFELDGTARSAFVGKWKINVLQIGFNEEKIDQNLFKAKN